MSDKKKNQIFLSFDVEEFDLPEEYHYGKVPEEEKFSVSGKGMERILDVIEEKKIKATYFITSDFAEHFPGLVKRMAATGGEIASHGRSHTTFAAADLGISKKILEEISGQTLTGFRMARLAPVKKEEILAAGYAYESSLNPIWLPGRYNHFSAPLLPFQERCGQRQFPISAVPWIRFPLFWLSFKTLPGWIYRLLAKITLKWTGYFNMYSHPWEYNEEARNTKWGIPGYITRHAGEDQAKRLGALIDAQKPSGEFKNFRDAEF